MHITVSNRCFPDVPLQESLRRLAGLDYTSSEIAIGNEKSDLSSDIVLHDPMQAERICRYYRSIIPSVFFFDIETTDPEYYQKFKASCKLAKLLKIVVITIRSALLGTPYNEEIERLRKLNDIGMQEGILVGILTQRGRVTELCDSVRSLCKSVPGLSVTLDPSEFIFGYDKPINFDSLIPLICHIHLRDTTSKIAAVQIGQGSLEYNKFLTQLDKHHYRGSIGVDLIPIPGIDQESELRKMRFLLESLVF